MYDNYVAGIILVVLVIAGIVYAKTSRKNRKQRLIDRDRNKPLKLQQAFDLVKDDNDFSGVYVITGKLTAGTKVWGQYKDGIIVIEENFLRDEPSLEKIACVMVHELAHHLGMNETQAGIIGKECFKKLSNKKK